MRDLAITFSALADTTRLEMMALLLRNDELCVCDFLEALGISQSKASRHLRYLWNARLLEDRRAGLWVYYRISRTMDAERKALVEALDRVMHERDLTDLDGKLARWFSRKGSSTGCAAPPPKKPKAPAQKPAKTRKPRPAVEARR
jgi:ArsR family transcriptional regulator, arsenate/arsenite/antimonite-responsive transcriptional repressor